MTSHNNRIAMPEKSGEINSFTVTDTLYPNWVWPMRTGELLALWVGCTLTILRHGLRTSVNIYAELGFAIVVTMLLMTVGFGLRYLWSLARPSFRHQHRAMLILIAVWSLGVVGIGIFGPIPGTTTAGTIADRSEAIFLWSEFAVVLAAGISMVRIIRRAATQGWDPALVVVVSFLILIGIGTLLLLLPRAQAEHLLDTPLKDRAIVALFTSTSATCVTGLTVVPTAEYWTRFGQVVILCLFQIGGLGIMTFGAFFAIATGENLQVKESVTFRDLLESEGLGDVTRLVKSIIIFTLICELVGAWTISGLWSDLPLGEQIFQSLFHSVSAFCNAGFTLTGNSFVGMGMRWQIWGGAAGLIILGGLGFAVLYNVMLVSSSRFRNYQPNPLFHLPRQRARLTLSSRLILLTTFFLLASGTLGYYLLETLNEPKQQPLGPQLCEAWFQSVTFRTAGFNTVDHVDLHPATKLFAIGLMFIGASPGSTGGGVKTICFALAVLAVISVMRGRDRVEVFGRAIHASLINRAVTMFTLGIAVVMITTLLLVTFENQPTRFLDLMFEATSAFATVGVSTSVTPELSLPSKWVVIVTMFLGRVGPMTLMLALSRRSTNARYEYPYERVTLG